MRSVILTALALPIIFLSDGCQCEDCSGFLLPVRTAYLRVTVHDTAGAGVPNVRVTVGTSRNSISTDTTDAEGTAVQTHHMYATPESAVVTLVPLDGMLVGTQLRVLLQDPDTTSITAVLRVP